jgi:hypothetical protein
MESAISPAGEDIFSMADFYNGIGPSAKGAWVVHHGKKTAATVNGSSEFPALDAAGKAASLLSQLAASDEITLVASKVTALARAAGLNPRTELPELLRILERRRVIDVSAGGDVVVVGLTSVATVRHAAEIFEEQDPSPEEQAAIAIAELASASPVPGKMTEEFVSDEFKMAARAVGEFLVRSETVGFIDAEGQNEDKLYFNGNLFRRDNVTKTQRVLQSLNQAENTLIVEFDARLGSIGYISLPDAEKTLGIPLLEKLRAAGMYDVNLVTNREGDHGIVTRPAAFHKFNDPLADDAFDLAKALVAALAYGMTQSNYGRGRIQDIGALLRRLIQGDEIGPATAIGEDYKVLETRGVIQVTRGERFGYIMKLLKRDIGEMALRVLTRGDTASTNAIDRPLPGKMTGFSGPEVTRADLRQKQVPASRRMTEDVLQALRTTGTF